MTVDTLFEQLKHPNPNLQARAMVELAEIEDDSIIPRLMGILDAEDVAYRRTAVKTLGVIGESAVPALIETLFNTDNTTVRASCTKALAQVAVNHPDAPFPEAGIEGLRKALFDLNPVVHITAAMALGAIGAPALDTLVEGLKQVEQPAVAVSIINALSSINSEKSVQALNEVLQDESADEYVKESATSALSRLDLVMKYKQ